MTPAEVPDCFDVNECLAECHPITDKWGACYVNDKEGIERAQRCLCAPLPGAAGDDFVNTLLAGACVTSQIGYLTAHTVASADSQMSAFSQSTSVSPFPPSMPATVQWHAILVLASMWLASVRGGAHLGSVPVRQR